MVDFSCKLNLQAKFTGFWHLQNLRKQKISVLTYLISLALTESFSLGNLDMSQLNFFRWKYHRCQPKLILVLQHVMPYSK